MKQLMIFALCLCLSQTSFGQFKIGIKGGLSTTNVTPSQLLIRNTGDLKTLGLSIEEANYGIHFGIFTQAQIGNFFIQPEILFNSNSVNYSVDDFSISGTADFIKNESFQNLDIPVLMGIKLGPLRLGAGPVAHVHLNSNSELFDFDGFDQKFKELTWGYQAGIGLDLWKLVLDFRYEGNFNKYGDHLVFFGNNYAFDDNPGQLVASVGFAF